MEEPWLDSLSEDWNSQPRSSPSALASSGQNSVKSRRQHANHDGTSSEVQGHLLQSPGSRSNLGQALLERSDNDINIPAHPSSPSSNAKPPRVLSKPDPSSYSSAGSILRHNSSVLRKSRSTSPPKSKRHNHTPEWKKLVKQGPGGIMVQHDLFSPMGLEGMFQRPTTIGKTVSGLHRQGISHLNSNEAMPSSPPPWPKSHRGALFASKSLEKDTQTPDTPTVPEDDKENVVELATRLDVAQNDQTSWSFADIQIPDTDDRTLSLVGDIETGQSQVTTAVEATLSAIVLSLPSLDKTQMSAPPMANNQHVHSRQSSSLGGFSPVFISKHHTVGGTVDYSALDLSDPRIIEHMKDFQQSKPGRDDAGNGATQDTAYEQEALKDHENDGDHDATSVCSSPNDSSLVPSDSVSQVFTERIPSFPIRRSSIRRESTGDSKSAQGITTESQTPPRPPFGDVQLNNAKRSPGSPLKLFANHDTFTNGRLLSRLTRLNEQDARDNEQSDPLLVAPVLAHGAETTDASSVPLESTEKRTDSIGSTDTTLHRDVPAAAQGILEKVGILGASEPREESQLYKPDEVKEDEKDQQLSSKPMLDMTLEPEFGHVKRSAPSPFKQPSPKRQRTVGQLEMASIAEYVSHHVEEQHQRMRAHERQSELTPSGHDGKGNGLENPDLTFSKKRNSTKEDDFTSARSNDGSPSRSDSLDSSDLDDDRLSSVHAHIEQTPIALNPKDAYKIRALASEVATIQLKGLGSAHGSIRKQSVSTQDYVNEAMKIMDFIRSNRVVQDRPSAIDLDQDDLTLPYDGEAVDTPTTLSRPPSRDGRANAWRSRNDERLDPRVISHLKKYQETGDESFRMSSALQFPEQPDHVNDGHDDEDDEFESQTDNIRITEARLPREDPGSGRSPVKTQSSEPSTDSSGRTIRTESSQKTRTVPVIGPGKVSHLIPDIEMAAGMRFDHHNKTWIKDRTLSSHHNRAMNCSSSTGTEDDPFGHIPDLSVNDMSGLVFDFESTGAANEQAAFVDTKDVNNSTYSSKGCSTRRTSNGSSEKNSNLGAAERVREESNLDLEATASAPDIKITHPSASSVGKQEATTEIHPDKRSARPLTVHDISHEAIEDGQVETQFVHGNVSEMLTDEGLCSEISDEDDMTLDQASQPGAGTLQRRRAVFSSPPVSREYPSQTWHEDTQSTYNNLDDVNGPLRVKPVRRHSRREKDAVDEGRMSYSVVSSARHKHLMGNDPNRTLSISRIDEHHEISLIGTRPDGRSLSMTFSVSTPLPAHRDVLRSNIPCTDVRSNLFLQSLSPLSEFTMHQDDARHLEARHLLPGHHISITDRSIKCAGVVNQLVTKLTDVEPDEPYWDALRTLNLNGKQLNHLKSLDEFCPSLEELDLSENRLQHLSGIPPMVRHLDVRNNCVSSLTTWGHLMNLQYLDLSHNSISDLDGLGNLLHLRELKVDDNCLTNLEGIFDLDSLLSFSARQNKLSVLDFRSADLRRLTKLNVGHNELQMVQGLDSLPMLEELILDYNNLTEFPTLDSNDTVLCNLHSLHVAHNSLSDLNVLPLCNLRYLDADYNNLSQVRNISQLKHLETLKIRAQSLVNGCLDESKVLNSFCEIRNLYLSGNSIKSFPVTVQFLNLQILEFAFTGLQSLPANFGTLMPNLRALNLNFNALKDLKPLRGISKLTRLLIAGNRISRLRKTLRVLGHFESLDELDIRDNPFSLGFYPPTSPAPEGDEVQLVHTEDASAPVRESNTVDLKFRHVLPSAQHERDAAYMGRLDEDTRLRRKVYELSLAVKCRHLRKVDGLEWDAKKKMEKDGMWEKLVGLGIVEKVLKTGTEDVVESESITRGGQMEAVVVE